MSTFPVDKVDALHVLEWPLLLVHSSYENVWIWVEKVIDKLVIATI